MKIECAYKELVSLEKIIPNPRNPNTHSKEQIKLLAKIIDAQGWRAPITVSNRSGFIVRGHGRLLAAQLLKHDMAPVDFQDYDSEAQEWADLIADNRIAELAEIDQPILKDLLQELDDGSFDMDLTGFDSSALEGLMLQTHEEGQTDDDEVPEPQESICKPGDLWVLGNHRLLCGDAEVITHIEKLMDGVKADLILTDPPYGINIVKVKNGGAAAIGGSKPYGKLGCESGPSPYGGKKKGRVVTDSLVKANLYRPVIGDDKPFDPAFLLTLSRDQVIFGANYFASKLPDGKAWIVWDKDASGMFSEVELAWTSLTGRLRMYKHMWSGLRREGSRDEELTKRVHPTQKPVGLFTQILTDFKGDNILDPFLGSGSTLIACEKLGRRCYGMEIDPHYCDVIIQRWQNFTGKTAELQ